MKLNPQAPLPHTRHGETRKIRLGKWDLYLTLNRDAAGVAREVFCKVARKGHPEGVDGSPLAWLDTMCRAASRGMQAGVRWEDILRDWRGTRFEPAAVGRGTSPLDAIAREFMEEGNDD